MRFHRSRSKIKRFLHSTHLHFWDIHQIFSVASFQILKERVFPLFLNVSCLGMLVFGMVVKSNESHFFNHVLCHSTPRFLLRLSIHPLLFFWFLQSRQPARPSIGIKQFLKFRDKPTSRDSDNATLKSSLNSFCSFFQFPIPCLIDMLFVKFLRWKGFFWLEVIQ